MTVVQAKWAWCLAGVWAVTIAGGVCLFNDYDLKAAATTPADQRWPAASTLRTEHGIATLVMALHPKCPCSALTLSELENALPRRHMRINVHVLVYQPKEFPQDWTMTPLVRRARDISGVELMFDKGGEELRKFHARVSGELWFYDGTGELRFRGGITGGRGHAGRNTGMLSLDSLFSGRPPVTLEAPVFGCAIGGEDRADRG